jgi:hydrogenase-4 membrane subunit HyfE
VIFRKVVGLVAAFAAIAAAAGVCVVAIAFALYATVRDYLGPAWGAAAVALGAALVALVLAWAVTRKARPKPVKGDRENLTAKLVELARERPLVALAAVGAAAAVVIRNPRILTAVIGAAFASRPPPKK